MKNKTIMHTRQEQLAAFERLLDVMDVLRVQCPWDKKQTFESLRENTIEEAFELASAISKKDMTEISKEVGDVLLHVVFYAKMGSETNDFDIADVCNKLCDKLIFRHPHVFKGEDANGQHVSGLKPDEVSQLWEQVKLKEKGGNKTVLSGIPDSLPSLVKAYRIQDKVANVGFDWEKKEDVWDKVKEEIAEFEAEIASSALNSEQNKQAMEAEFGDLLFSLINAARLYKIRPDSALEQTNIKFIKRFNYVEQRAKELGKSLQEMTLSEMEALWQEAKKA
jgi:XTP/dITP diphosphohydrolase